MWFGAWFNIWNKVGESSFKACNIIFTLGNKDERTFYILYYAECNWLIAPKAIDKPGDENLFSLVCMTSVAWQ
jgi:hypothetical protein